MGTWESSGTPKSSEFDRKGQNTSYWRDLYIIGKLSKCRCPKWTRMTHVDICNTSYGQKKGRELNYQTDSLTPDHRKSGIDLIPLCAGYLRHVVGKISTMDTTLVWTSSWSKVCIKSYSPAKLQDSHPWQFQDSHLGQKTIQMSLPWSGAEYTIWGKVVASPRVRAVVSLVSPELPMACPSTKGAPESDLTNLLVGLMQVRVSN
jgi:hypothetical protein